jgi:hypothetical protein
MNDSIGVELRWCRSVSPLSKHIHGYLLGVGNDRIDRGLHCFKFWFLYNIVYISSLELSELAIRYR